MTETHPLEAASKAFTDFMSVEADHNTHLEDGLLVAITAYRAACTSEYGELRGELHEIIEKNIIASIYTSGCIERAVEAIEVLEAKIRFAVSENTRVHQARETAEQRVRELEAELNLHRRGEDEGYQHTLQELGAAEAECDKLTRDIERAMETNTELATRIRELERALRFYANPDVVIGFMNDGKVEACPDSGATARKALEPTP